MGPQELRIADFTYDLPEDRIAKYPLEERDASKLLIYKKGRISETIFRELPERIPPDALLVFNDTKVIEARLLFRKESGGQIEVFCLEPLDTEPSRAMAQRGSAVWKCLVGGAGKWKSGALRAASGPEALHAASDPGAPDGVVLTAEKVGEVPDGYLIRFTWEPAHLHFAEVLHRAGQIPLPPYLGRQPEEKDAQRYQTVYAREEGSVAAPTAGLHITQNILKELAAKGVKTAFVTLHVGAGTFKPVKSEIMKDHVMHSEWIDVSKDTIREIANARGPIIAVGTTAFRTLESLYWLGVGKTLDQWTGYEESAKSRKEALENLKGPILTRTQLLVAPGYRPRIADALITNFHQPGSTLLLLVAALLGEDWKKVYQYALQQDFRFLSYGDGSLLWF